MPKKKIEVVELNKKEEKIILEEAPSAIILFWRKYRGLLVTLLLALAISLFSVSTYLFFKNVNKNEIPKIKEAQVDSSLTDNIVNFATDNILTEETAKVRFNKSGYDRNRGEVLLVKKIENSNFIVKYFSDGIALKISKNGKNITKVKPLEDGSYGIDESGIINSKASSISISAGNTKEYPWGKVTYYSDGSAEITNSKVDLYVRDSSDITDDYISDNKVAYLKDTKTVGNNKLNYYYDGTVEVIKGNTSYVVRKESDLNITGSDVTFKNNNAGEIYKTVKTNKGLTIDYYTDGGAIIRDGSKTLSVRKSNSIIIKNNDLFEIVDSIYVTEAKKTDTATYYTNGGAVVNYNGNTLYIPENSDVTYTGNNINSVGSESEEFVKERNNPPENVKFFEETAVVTTNDYIAILPKENVIYKPSGEIKELLQVTNKEDDDSGKTFTITNNTGTIVHYRVAIQQSDSTSVDTQYIRYQMRIKEKYLGPIRLNDSYWNADAVSKELNVTGTNYILAEDKLEPYEASDVSLMLWADYDTIPNSQMDKYFYGTIRIYAWQDISN